MGEDFPVDPNQVQPPHESQPDQQPQEGEATHIEIVPSVSTEESEAQEESEDWDSDREGRGGLTDQETRAVSDEEMEAESGIYHSEHDEMDDEDDEISRPAPSDPNDPSIQLTAEEKQKSPGRIRNKDKAEAMAHAENLYGHYGYRPDGGAWHRRVNAGSIEDAVQKAGDEYEVSEIAERDGKSPEEVRKLLSGNRKAFLDYSRAIIENQKQYGDKLSPNYVVLEAVHELADRYPDLIKNGYLESRDMSISIKHFKVAGGALNVNIDHHHHTDQDGNIYEERWRAPTFNSVSSWRTYEATSYSTEDPDFDSATTTKRRSMREEDAQRLKDLLADANFDPEPEDNHDYREDDDEPVSMGEIQRRAIASMGDTEEAREAARDFPGDFM